jgi:hypothetical protein
LLGPALLFGVCIKNEAVGRAAKKAPALNAALASEKMIR